MADAVVIFDAETERVALLNPAAHKLLGAQADEAIGQCVWTVIPAEGCRVLCPANPDSPDTADDVLSGFSSGSGQPQRIRVDPDADCWIEVTLSRIDGAHQGRHFMAAVCRDVTNGSATIGCTGRCWLPERHNRR